MSHPVQAEWTRTYHSRKVRQWLASLACDDCVVGGRVG